jgi:heat shock protein HtpX
MEYSIAKHRLLLIVESIAIFLIMLALLTIIGLQLFGYSGLLLSAGGIIFIVIVANRRMAYAQPQNVSKLSEDKVPRMYEGIRELSQRANLQSVPELYLFDAQYMNAATLDKPGEPMIIVTPPVVNQLSDREVTALLAHEVAHIQSRDVFFQRIVQAVYLLTQVVAQTAWIMLILFFPIFLFSRANLPLYIIAILFGAPVLSILLQLAFSRSREFNADLGAVELTGEPLALAEALEKIEKVQSRFLDTMLPFPTRRNRRESSLFSSHPAIPKRIEKLKKIAEEHPRTPSG